MSQFREQSGITFPIARTTNRSYSSFTQGSSLGSISPFPLDVLIDKNGDIAYLSREYEPVELQRIIESALAQP